MTLTIPHFQSTCGRLWEPDSLEDKVSSLTRTQWLTPSPNPHLPFPLPSSHKIISLNIPHYQSTCGRLWEPDSLEDKVSSLTRTQWLTPSLLPCQTLPQPTPPLPSSHKIMTLTIPHYQSTCGRLWEPGSLEDKVSSPIMTLWLALRAPTTTKSCIKMKEKKSSVKRLQSKLGGQRLENTEQKIIKVTFINIFKNCKIKQFSNM